jgi:bifunctional non-homologous end joining protein LigD
MRTRRTGGFIEPCLPTCAKAPPSGPEWIHEIKHDGFRIMACRDGAGVHPLARKGNDFTPRFPQIAAAVAALPVWSCLIDGEAIVCNEAGLAVFDLARQRRRGPSAVLCAFDLLELDGRDLRFLPIEHRKRTLAKTVRGAHPGIVLNEHYEGDGETVFKHACKQGCEGIVSKRLGSSYRSGRCSDWIKVKNPAAPTVTREAEEDCT